MNPKSSEREHSSKGKSTLDDATIQRLLSAHPLDELVVRGGVLVHAKPGYADAEYLGTPAIEVIAKADVIELDGPHAAFLFRLNHLSDELWESLFVNELRGARAEIQGAQLELVCAPEDLERSYGVVRAAIRSANEHYARLRSDLHGRVVALAADREARADAGRNESIARRQKLLDQFDQLSL